MLESFVQRHATGKRQRHTPSFLTLGLYWLHTSVSIFGFEACDGVWVFKFSSCLGPSIFKSNSTHLRHRHSGPMFVCKLFAYTDHLCMPHVMSHHLETQAWVRILANTVHRCISNILIFACMLAMDDQEEERKKCLDERIWWCTALPSLPMAWDYKFRWQGKALRNNRWKNFFLPQPQETGNHQSIKVLVMPQLQLIIQAGE